MGKDELCSLVQFKIWNIIYAPGLLFHQQKFLEKKKAHKDPHFSILLMGSWLVTGFEEGPLSSTWQTAAMMKGWLLGMGQASALSDSDAMKY